MARGTKLYFATDVHGSEKCFRKFLNGAAAYKPDVLVLGGDIAGKAIQAIEENGIGRYTTTFRGHRYDVDSGAELEQVERMIADLGYYPWRCAAGELDARVADGSVDGLLIELMQRRLVGWMKLAEERLRPLGKPAFWMLGNDDPPILAESLDAAPWGEHAEDRVLAIDEYELISFGWSNRTPWDSFREMSEEEIAGNSTSCLRRSAIRTRRSSTATCRHMRAASTRRRCSIRT